MPELREFTWIATAAAVLSSFPLLAGDEPGVWETLPGAAPHTESLQRALAERRASRGSDYRPRTRYLRSDGRARFTNRLFLEASPYLLQHAHNPVDWYPWGEAAFEEARRRNVPVLLSVGYSTCHWCHVMEEESFEDEEIARYLNQHYVAIKVDREERPDVDAIYMAAVQRMTGRGGWPMTVWLTADREPFFGGTYFPARDGERGPRVGFLTLLQGLQETYRDERDAVASFSARLVEAIRAQAVLAEGAGVPDVSVLDQAFELYRTHFDQSHGGSAGAPKFPSSLPARFLLRHHRRTGDERALGMATLTLEKMARGGIHDQVGGGFHRYATDAVWLVPHFEKMLYDNALLAMDYLEAYQATGREDFADIVHDILRYVERDMTSADGGFYSASDADSRNPSGESEEGWFFTWTPAELIQVLGEADASLIAEYYGVTPGGNFEGRSILSVVITIPELAARHDLSASAAAARLEAARDKLYGARSRRAAPLRDEKILTAWNALMISAYAQAGLILDEPRYIAAARGAARFLLAELASGNRLRRSYIEGRARIDGYLDDYAFFVAALLDLYEASGELHWFERALALDGTVAAEFEDHERGGFYLTGVSHEPLLARQKPDYDGAVPTGNSVAVANLLRLYEFTMEEAYRQRAERALRYFGARLTRSPTAMSGLLVALDFYHDTVREIVIVTAARRAESRPFLDELASNYLPNRVLTVLDGDAVAAHARLIPLVAGKRVLGGRATAYVCERGVCQLPTGDPSEFARQLVATVAVEKRR